MGTIGKSFHGESIFGFNWLLTCKIHKKLVSLTNEEANHTSFFAYSKQNNSL